MPTMVRMLFCTCMSEFVGTYTNVPEIAERSDGVVTKYVLYIKKKMQFSCEIDQKGF